VAYVPTVEAAGRTVAKLYRKGVPPPRLMELMDDQFLQLGGLANESRNAVILIGTDGFTSEEAKAKLDAIFEVAQGLGAAKTEQLTAAEFQKFIGFRNVGEKGDMIKELGLFPLFGGVMDGPLDAMAPCMEAAGRMLKEVCDANPGLYGVRIGHIGGGTFHPVFFAPQSWEFDRLQALAAEMRAHMLKLQLDFDCTTGEQGIFPQHYDWFHRYYGTEYASVVSRIRDALDPQHILNDARFQRPDYRNGRGVPT
jgi:FAD/FMN-containing dehydrogenase